MKKSIYDVYVTVTSQEQADRLKDICLEYGLQIWNDEFAFEYDIDSSWFGALNFKKHNDTDFFIGISDDNKRYTQIAESEFEQLAKEFKQ
jgi:hypothetical protein